MQEERKASCVASLGSTRHTALCSRATYQGSIRRCCGALDAENALVGGRAQVEHAVVEARRL
eukprot:1270509-Prymnesium_polylepis.1